MVGRWRLIAAVAMLVVGGIIAAILSAGSTNKAAAPPAASETDRPRAGCVEPPARAATPTWYPKDLQLPEGSYAASGGDQSQPNADAHIFVVNSDLEAFIAFVATEWRKSGWITAGGDREADEAEAPFQKGSKTGRFRARNVYCDAEKTEVLIAINK